MKTDRYNPTAVSYFVSTCGAVTAFVVLMGSSSLLANPSSPVALASVAAVTADARTGEVIVAKHPDAVLPIASVTKLMTALVVLESGAPLDEWVTITGWNQELTKNAYSRIRIDSQIRRRDLLRIALMSSENLAAYNLALLLSKGRPAEAATWSCAWRLEGGRAGTWRWADLLLRCQQTLFIDC